MLYDIRLHLSYDYDAAAGGSRHQVRVLPPTIAGVQRVVVASLSFVPNPSERTDFSDFFGNNVTAIAFRDVHDGLDIKMSARVSVSRPEPGLDVSPDLQRLKEELGSVRSLSPSAPHHFLAASDHVGIDAAITAYARESLAGSTVATAVNLCNRIHRDFTYDGKATTVQTRASDAFALKRGVCQDFSHIMIAGLRGLGIPAGYVSGFLRTIPPKGKPRLEGADAMHAWVKAWCGRDAGWQEFDPTNGMRASNDHITVGYGRDYSDVAPIVGVLKTTGGQVGEQAVDVIPVAMEKV
ncbi:transglutaminase family protein [Mesorhizobium sp. M2D.F.Ca.ET.223.01.1.1]|uniref:transglutaminase family protein n=1 Tax=unclassified Mesorhizobium TaxID=325217 RepID=UPI000FCA9AA8|nr:MULTISPECIES: transglutaminase family protein [unclassified Mesorhizobium]TGP82568.1 transglutaminase family protein [bacterium M00.F.Ca.ET.227.01.1.1]TGP94322.1 transglutaminase family protein [bacterium M00.F.Ca.ET.221.01.1.1]TGP97776.1 transglutaminase family protein [bacterium M00.F.Ca.ET.222.01.1.1]TGT75126.1 transglutaminase family protein [bacterium M00.F.Ca.ET.159.01.1.1]TGT87993.1 transglutaminase family protein [bacterium M00.F.Ca.ET.157.01.1.1]TGU11912.1 transglutaminase family 